jgi:hypothetical protein
LVKINAEGLLNSFTAGYVGQPDGYPHTGFREVAVQINRNLDGELGLK